MQNFFPASLACIREIMAAVCRECHLCVIGEPEFAMHDPDVRYGDVDGQVEVMEFMIQHRHRHPYDVGVLKIRFMKTHEATALTALCEWVAHLMTLPIEIQPGQLRPWPKTR